MMIAIDIVGTDPNYIAHYVELIPVDLVESCEDTLRKLLEPVDFMPDWASVFLVAPYSNEDLMEAKERFRPRYLQIVGRLRRRLDRRNEIG